MPFSPKPPCSAMKTMSTSSARPIEVLDHARQLGVLVREGDLIRRQKPSVFGQQRRAGMRVDRQHIVSPRLKRSEYGPPGIQRDFAFARLAASQKQHSHSALPFLAANSRRYTITATIAATAVQTTA